MDGPDQIGPDHRPKQTIGDKVYRLVRRFTTR
jgi:NCS2 family nucleobase:cation symporter-2